MPYLKGNIQDRITDLREQNGWSKAELAERIGIDASRMGRIESGETKSVSDDVILALAKAFGVSTDFLLGVSDDPEPNNYDIKDEEVPLREYMVRVNVGRNLCVYEENAEDDGAGKTYTITADFRKYPCIEDSIGDHSAYLLGAKNGEKLRYDGLKGCTDYKKAVQIIKNGGYATSTTYVSKLCSIIEKWNLTQYDSDSSSSVDTTKWYRVRKSWSDAASQKGAFKVLANAKVCADENPGYLVFDDSGKVVYTTSSLPYRVKVTITDLNIRKGPGTNYAKTGKYTGVGTFTIVEERSGKGSTAGWGRLKSGAGWISLDYATRIN